MRITESWMKDIRFEDEENVLFVTLKDPFQKAIQGALVVSGNISRKQKNTNYCRC